VTLAKALGAGLPIGAMISSDEVSHGFAPGSHGSTFSGNAVSCRVAMAVLETMEEDDLLAHVVRVGRFFGKQLEKLGSGRDWITGSRGRGLIWGLGMDKPWARAVVNECMKRGLLVNRLNDHTVRFLPPLITQQSHIRAACEILDEALTHVQQCPPE
jgi:acetylornithine/N-succinyldiaminopimelate aminotransferase